MSGSKEYRRIPMYRLLNVTALLQLHFSPCFTSSLFQQLCQGLSKYFKCLSWWGRKPGGYIQTWESPMLGQKCTVTKSASLKGCTCWVICSREKGLLKPSPPPLWDCMHVCVTAGMCPAIDLHASTASCASRSPACTGGCSATCSVRSCRMGREAPVMADLRVDVCFISTGCTSQNLLKTEPAAFVSCRQYMCVQKVAFHRECLRGLCARTGSPSELAVTAVFSHFNCGEFSYGERNISNHVLS